MTAKSPSDQLHQGTLFDVPTPTPCGVPEHDRERVEAQRAKLLERLQRGPATSEELSRIAQRFGARIHELRKEGHMIDAKHVSGGLWLYTLIRGQ
jgi:hypothetical protein